MKKAFPVHGIIGIALLFLSEIFLFKKVEPFYSWFYCFAWWSYILTIDGIIYCLKGNSLILSRTKEFFLMIPWSIFIWLIFETANLSLKNWYYIHLPHSVVERWIGYAVAYGTVLPGLFETTELLETAGLFNRIKMEKTVISRESHLALFLLGILCLVSSVLIPEYFFPLIWVGFLFTLDPLLYRAGGRSLLRDLEEGNPRKLYLLLLAGLVCGLLWEFWNFWTLSKWIYTVPFFEERKGFEMPVLGFLGFPPFALQAYVMYHTISFFRFQRGWEESMARPHPEKKTKPLAFVLTALLIGIFSVSIFRAIDFHTVDSYYPRLEDAYWIDPHHRKELPKAGIVSMEDLISKTREKKDRDELALRLLVPKEEFIQWVEKAKLVQLKGMGVENLRVLERVGIHSIPALAAEDGETVYHKIKEMDPWGKIPRIAKIRIWIREAQKEARGTRDEG
jgi:hypothetical protein